MNELNVVSISEAKVPAEPFVARHLIDGGVARQRGCGNLRKDFAVARVRGDDRQQGRQG